MSNIPWNENLRLCRERFHYLQKELSEKLNISERTLQRYEAGISEPTVSILLKLSEIYELSIDEILGNTTTRTFNRTAIDRHLKDIENSCKTLRREMYESEI